MHSDQYPYRELHDEMPQKRGPCELDLLASWLRQYPDEVEWLQALGARSHDVAAEALGLTVVVPRQFTPFDCEIVGAKNAEAGERSIVLTDVRWPCLMLGRLLIARAGVSISGSREIFDEAIASSSTLYWAYRRKTRPYQDLSHGWGSNSQWRTSFRRDYRLGGKLYFNVDGDRDLTASVVAPVDDEGSLTREERIELLTNRCFILTDKASHDLWPFDDTFQMGEAGAAELPLEAWTR